jgi:RHS repeat-associated protein
VIGLTRPALGAALLVSLAGTLAPASVLASVPRWSDVRADGSLSASVLPASLPSDAEPASAAADAFLKTRVRAFDFARRCFVGGVRGLTCASRPAYEERYGGAASKSSFSAKYDYGSERLIRVSRPGDAAEPIRYFHFDKLGTTTALTDETGAPKAAFHVDAHGELRDPSELAGTKNRVLFTGYTWSASTGLYYANARWYDPATSRFTTADDPRYTRIDDPPSLNRYQYAAGNPTRYVDPTGHAVGDWWDPRTYMDRREDAQEARRGYAFGQGCNFGYGPCGSLAHASPEVQKQTLNSFGTQFKEGMKGAEADKGAVIVVASVGAAVALGRMGGEEPAKAPGTSKPITGTVVESNAGAPAVEPVPSQRVPVVAGGSQAADAAPAPGTTTTAPNTGAGTAASADRLAGSKLEHMNASIGELHGYEEALGQGHVPIRGPGKTTARGADYLTYDPVQQEVVFWDAKYRGPQGGSVPRTLAPAKIQRWTPEARKAIEVLPDSPLKADMLRALDAGQVRGEIFKWPR